MWCCWVYVFSFLKCIIGRNREGADRMNELPKVVFSRTLGSRSNGTPRAATRCALSAASRWSRPSWRRGWSTRSGSSCSHRSSARRDGTGREPIFAGLPDVDLELIETNVLDGRLVTLEYRPANANPTV